MPTPSPSPGDSKNLTSIMLEPRQGQTDQECTAWLHAQGITDWEVLAPGFISAIVPQRLLKSVSHIAEVTVKAKKQSHG